MTEALAAAALQFGAPRPGRRHRDRPAAFGIALWEGKLAVVRIQRPGEDYIDLPGGGVEAGETEIEALIREFGEEAGLVVEVGDLLTRSSQFLITGDDDPANNRAGHFIAEVVREDAALKIEDDHTLVWIDPVEALKHLRHDSHAFALATWLRRDALAAGS